MRPPRLCCHLLGLGVLSISILNFPLPFPIPDSHPHPQSPIPGPGQVPVAWQFVFYLSTSDYSPDNSFSILHQSQWQGQSNSSPVHLRLTSNFKLAKLFQSPVPSYPSKIAPQSTAVNSSAWIVRGQGIQLDHYNQGLLLSQLQSLAFPSETKLQPLDSERTGNSVRPMQSGTWNSMRLRGQGQKLGHCHNASDQGLNLV